MIYRWKLTANNVTTLVHPVYKDDLTLDYEMESGQRFFRAKLGSKINFVGVDADIIINGGFTTEFILVIESSTNYGQTWSEYYRAHFYQTDCTINADDHKVTVQPQVIDQYNKILDGWEKEYNLIDLLPVTERVTLKKRALLQLYAGDGKVTNIFGGFSWEQDFDIGDTPPSDYHFKDNFSFCVIKFTTSLSWVTGLTKSFIAQPDANGEFETTNGEEVYYLKRERQGDGWMTQLRKLSDNSIEAYYYNSYIILPDTMIFNVAGQAGYTFGVATCSYLGVYARWLCDVESFVVNGQTYQTHKVTSSDPAYGGNLHYVIEAEVSIVPSNNISETATKWGKYDDTYYYDKPSVSGFYYVPVARSYWSTASIWYRQQLAEYRWWEPAMQKPYTLKDSYPLWSVLSVLLQANGTNVTFQPTTDYSEFLFSATNPVDNKALGTLHITPKSNILVGEYTQPSMKAPVTLHDVLGMLKNAFDCYWFVDSSNRLRIEHISWFKNGGSYGGTHQVDANLTSMIQSRNMKPWSFGTNEWQFDKVEMPARYQYKWMDAGTDVFDGFPYEIQSPFVQTDKVEEITISNFTSDIDFMQIAPENCSKDGFALLMVKNDGNGNYVELIYNSRETEAGTCYSLSQNYRVSLKFLQQDFLCYDLPAWDYICDGDSLTAQDIMRGKRQSVVIPYGNNTPDVMKLVHTAMGDGQVQKLSLNLSSRTGKATLMYETYSNS